MEVQISQKALDEAMVFKESGNKLFHETHYQKAIEEYAKALQCMGSKHKLAAIIFSNKAQCEILLENYGIASEDAKAAIEADPMYSKAYYRNATALYSLGKIAEAIAQLEKIQTVVGLKDNQDVIAKLKALRQIKREKDFFGSFSYDAEVVTYNEEELAVDPGYKGPELTKDSALTREWIENLIEFLKGQNKLHKKYLWTMLRRTTEILCGEGNIVEVNVKKPVEQITVCGDVHGQFYDLLNIFKMNGLPSAARPYLFNGDFVDRGSFSVEVMILLMALKIADPKSIFLNRGNHENPELNKLYGFEGEVLHKYCSKTFSIFTHMFFALPLATLLSHEVLVVHGGLFQQEGVKLADIKKLDRFRAIPNTGLMCDILWADPGALPGRKPNTRGVSIEFGPDVTQKFLHDNDLKLLVRSHQVKEEGFEFVHANKVITVFSAPKYCDTMTNKGAFIVFKEDLEPKVTQFESVPHPNVPAMAYARGNFMFR